MNDTLHNNSYQNGLMAHLHDNPSTKVGGKV